MSFAEWFTMGGYAWFVWPAYLIGLIVLVWNLYLPVLRHRRLIDRRRTP